MKSKKITLFLVRHGENRANLTLEFSSRRVDYSLTPKGVMQAEQTGAYFAALQTSGRPLHAIYSSPLKRAAETAAIIGARVGLPVEVREQFREVNVGDLELVPPSRESWERHNQILYAWADGRHAERFPGGEDYHELRSRAMDGYRLALAGRQEQNVLIVAHGGIFTFTLHVLCSDLNANWVKGRLNANCSVSEIEVETDGDQLVGRLVRWADFSHLSGPAAELVAGLPDTQSFQQEGRAA